MKIQKENERKIKAWFARDKDGYLWAYSKKPYKLNDEWCVTRGEVHIIRHYKFPQVKWTDKEPTEVEITIKVKEKSNDSN